MGLKQIMGPESNPERLLLPVSSIQNFIYGC